jgi:hypothetical protein
MNEVRSGCFLRLTMDPNLDKRYTITGTLSARPAPPDNGRIAIVYTNDNQSGAVVSKRC